MRLRIRLFVSAALVALSMSLGGVAFGAEHHPSSKSVKDNPCTDEKNHPNCPGVH